MLLGFGCCMLGLVCWVLGVCFLLFLFCFVSGFVVFVWVVKFLVSCCLALGVGCVVLGGLVVAEFVVFWFVCFFSVFRICCFSFCLGWLYVLEFVAMRRVAFRCVVLRLCFFVFGLVFVVTGFRFSFLFCFGLLFFLLVLDRWLGVYGLCVSFVSVVSLCLRFLFLLLF